MASSSSQTPRPLVSFVDALKRRYGSADDDAEEPLGVAFAQGGKWRFVGAEQTRAKQSCHDRLTLVVLRNCGISVAMHEPSATTTAGRIKNELQEANMIRLEELDLSENTALSLAEVGKLMPYLPRLATLQLCDMPDLLLTAPPATAVLSSSHLSKLVLNNTGFRSLAQLRALVEAPTLRELHLDANKLTSLDLVVAPPSGPPETAELTADNSAVGAAAGEVVFPQITTLSLAQNELSDWKALSAAITQAFPALTQLYLTDNKLEDLVLPEAIVARAAAGEALTAELEDGGVLQPYRFLRPLTLLCLKDNATLCSPATIDAVRILCPQLTTFRITYSTLLPTWKETCSRMYVVAALPTITLLNRGTVRPIERLDSELLYIQRGLLQRQRDQETRDGAGNTGVSATAAPPPRIAYPLVDVLKEKHKDVVLAIQRDSDAALSMTGTSYVMLSVTLFFVNGYALASPATASSSSDPMAKHTQRLPSTLTVAKLKSLVQHLFQVKPANQRLSYRSGDDGVLEARTPLDNELETLAYYGMSDGAVVYVEDASLR
ncbi:hypothetical protein LSCM1_08115 [Leishmania martiniquensis]|uniref:Ubiquitin-like domain-containing protein n=1 Tax=Leishmania martiniquensis TaxID=1580590 RepID=A0A836HAC3_9TRYP|nr:hypothetical protein LSCM1_08115 [Leishmania martiniquensis]